MATKVLILLGTKKGAFILESDALRSSWQLRGPFCETWPMNHAIADPATGTIVRSIEVAADAGTAFDGRHLFQLAEDRIQKSDGGDQFFCGGGRSGRLRTVRRRRRDD